MEKFQSKIYASSVGKGGAYVKVPFNIKEKYGKGRLKVQASFDGVLYTGSIVNMGITNEDGSVCYILGILKSIRKTIKKDIGDLVEVCIEVREEGSLKTKGEEA